MYNAWDGEGQYGLESDEFTASLEVSNNFAINVDEGNNEYQELQVMYCTKPLHMLTTPLKCKWGTKYDVGDNVVTMKYY